VAGKTTGADLLLFLILDKSEQQVYRAYPLQITMLGKELPSKKGVAMEPTLVDTAQEEARRLVAATT